MLIIRIILFGEPYTICNVLQEKLVFPSIEYYKSIGIELSEGCELVNDVEILRKNIKLKLTASALYLQYFMKCLCSELTRTNLLLNMNRWYGNPVNLRLILKPPDKEIIDYAWNDRMLRVIWTRVEIENAFSWLSTLGGAYSALGDYFEHCAEEAGRISIRQYKLSLILGDESLAARSKLYSALACAQKGKLRTSRHIVRKVNAFAITTKDKRLNRMCLGVWAKLKYMRSLKKQGSCYGDST